MPCENQVDRKTFILTATMNEVGVLRASSYGEDFFRVWRQDVGFERVIKRTGNTRLGIRTRGWRGFEPEMGGHRHHFTRRQTNRLSRPKSTGC